MIEGQAQRIIEILKKEHSYYKDMLTLSNKKKTIIIESKLPELDKIVKIEQNMVFDLGQLEKAREQELQKLCTMLQMDGRTNVTELVKHLPPQMAEQLKVLQQEMSSTIAELQNVNKVNGQLIQQSLDYIEYSVNMIASAGPANSLYEDLKPTGQSTGNNRRLFDTKV